MILAAPLVIPFAEAVGISVASIGMAKAADMVNDYIQENPEQSVKILSAIVPNVGIGQIFANKEDSGDDEEVEVEEDTRSKKEIVLEGVRRAREGKGNYSSPDATGSAVSGQGNVIRGLEDAGKIKKDPDPNYDPSKKYQGYKRFLKKADGGAIGIEVLFGPKRQELFMGGPALTGPALNIFNSMKAYQSFTDQEIADAIKEAGYELPTASLPTAAVPSVQAPQVSDNREGGEGGDGGVFNSRSNFMPTGEGYTSPMFQNIKNKFSSGIEGLMDNPITNIIGAALNPGFAALKGLAGLLPPNKRAAVESAARDSGIQVDDIGRIVTNNYNTPEGIMAGYNLDKLTDKSFDKRTNTISETLQGKYGLTKDEVAEVIAGTYAGKKGLNKITGKTTNLFDTIRNVKKSQKIIGDVQKQGLASIEKERLAALEKAKQERIAKAKIAKAEKAERDRIAQDKKQKAIETKAKNERDMQQKIAAAQRLKDLQRGRGGVGRDGPSSGTGRGATSATSSGLGNLGFSDIRLKENVELIGKSPSNINIYKFNYKDNPTTYQGAMAHEVPWASIKHSNGYMMIDYNQIDVEFKKI
jgi:hypothetical protein